MQDDKRYGVRVRFELNSLQSGGLQASEATLLLQLSHCEVRAGCCGGVATVFFFCRYSFWYLRTHTRKISDGWVEACVGEGQCAELG